MTAVAGSDLVPDGLDFLQKAERLQVFKNRFPCFIRRKASIFAAVKHFRLALCRTAFEKLAPGGVLILETPNPRSLAVYTNAFYLDPSHVKPVHPLTMQYLLQKEGFKDVQLLFPEQSRPPQRIPALDGAPEAFNEAMQTVSDTLYGAQDYAVIAVR